MASSLILSHFDYGNSILTGLPDRSLRPLQLVQNYAAKVITKKRKFDSATEALKEVHWLPIRQRCQFKILLLTYKALHNLAPEYLKDLLNVKSTSYCTRRSNDPLLLHVPFCYRKTFYERSFSVLAPRLWNNLPFNIRNSSTVTLFKKNLKTHLFKNAFSV